MIESEVYRVAAVVDWMRFQHESSGHRPSEKTLLRQFPYYSAQVIEYAIEAYEESPDAPSALAGMTPQQRALYIGICNEVELVKRANRLLSRKLQPAR